MNISSRTTIASMKLFISHKAVLASVLLAGLVISNEYSYATAKVRITSHNHFLQLESIKNLNTDSLFFQMLLS